MKNKISTLIGTSLLVIVAITIVVFVWAYERGQVWDTNITTVQQRVTPKNSIVQQKSDYIPIPGIFRNQVYTNETYSFQITIPKGWTYKEFDRENDPVFVFYEDTQENALRFSNGASHFHEGTFVLVAPTGISTDGLPGKWVPSIVKFSEEVESVRDMTLISGEKWVTSASFKKPPKQWASYGFIFGENYVSDRRILCLKGKQIINEGVCNSTEESAVTTYQGKVNPSERKQIQQILSTFKFLKDPMDSINFSPFEKWRTYTNHELGITFKFPPELNRYSQDKETFFDPFDHDNPLQKDEGSILTKLKISLKNEPLDQLIEERKNSELRNLLVTDINLGDVSSKKLTYTDAFAGGQMYEIYLSKGNQTILIWYSDFSKTKDTYEKMLQTLDFTGE